MKKYYLKLLVFVAVVVIGTGSVFADSFGPYGVDIRRDKLGNTQTFMACQEYYSIKVDKLNLAESYSKIRTSLVKPKY